jgi:tetratricopeptide (TPR) repeat protein
MPFLVRSVCWPALLAVLPGVCGAADRSAATGPRVVMLITWDGGRADLLDHPDRIPFTSRIAHEGRSIDFATAPTSVTFPATVSVMTGLYPDRHGVPDDFAAPLGPGPVTLAELFRNAGWKTAAYPADYLSHGRSGIDRGFESFEVASPSFEPNARADSAVAFVGRHRGDRSLVWIGFSLLAPQQPWERFRGGSADSTDYLDRARSADRAIERLLTGLERVVSTREALVVIVGTHGESVPGWKPAEAPPDEDSPSGHGLDLSEAVLRIPMVLFGAGIPAGGARTDRMRPDWASTVDLLPTIASLAGIPVPDGLDGISLKPVLEGRVPASRPIFHEVRPGRALGWGARFGVREGRVKLLYYGGSIAVETLGPGGAPEPGSRELEDRKAALRTALQERFGVDVRWPVSGARDTEFGWEDEPMRLLAQARVRTSTRAAAETLDPLVARFPNNGPIQIERALLDVYGRREKLAATALDSLRRAHPEYVEAEAAYAELLFRFDRTGVAVQRLASLGGWPMFEVDRLWRLGAAQVLAKLYDDAARTYRQAESIGYPSDERLVYLRDQRLRIRQLDAEISSYPDGTAAMIQMGHIFGRIGLYDDTYVWIHRARGRASQDPEPEYWLGHYLMEEGRAKHAVVAFRRALEKDSTRVDARVELAYAEISMGEHAQALANLRIAAASGTTDALVDYNLACLLARDGATDEALRYLSSAVQKGYSNRKLVESDPDLEPLRADPKFRDILTGMR